MGVPAVTLISVPYSSGRRDHGMGRGPTVLLDQHGLAERLSSDGFDVAVDTVEIPDGLVPEIARTFELNRRLAVSVRNARAEGAFPLVLSGNCNCSWGATAGSFGDDAPAVLWLDAHADFDVPDDNLSGFLDVMALSTLTGACWQALAATVPGFRPVPERNVLLVGVRDLDDYQRKRLQESEISVSWGGGDPVLEAFDPGASRMYLHVDLDSLDPSVGQANEFSAPDGLSLGRVLVLQREAVAGFEPVCAAVTRTTRTSTATARWPARPRRSCSDWPGSGPVRRLRPLGPRMPRASHRRSAGRGLPGGSGPRPRSAPARPPSG